MEEAGTTLASTSSLHTNSASPKEGQAQQERQRFKVQALSQLDAIANERLRAVNAELTPMAWARNQRIWLRLDQPHSNRMHCEIVDNHGEPLLMSNQELYSVMVQINWTLKTQALTNMQVQWRPKTAGKWHPFQWEAILHCPTAEGHRAVPPSVSRNGDCMHFWLTGRADLLRLFQRTLFRQADPVSGDAVRFLYTLLRHHEKKHTMKPGDWICPHCGNHNYAQRTRCHTCTMRN